MNILFVANILRLYYVTVAIADALGCHGDDLGEQPAAQRPDLGSPAPCSARGRSEASRGTAYRSRCSELRVVCNQKTGNGNSVNKTYFSRNAF